MAHGARSMFDFDACERRTAPLASGPTCFLVALPRIVVLTSARAQTSSTSGPWDDPRLASQITDAVGQFIAADHTRGRRFRSVRAARSGC